MRNLKDRLAHLTYKDACRLLGPRGEGLKGGDTVVSLCMCGA